MGAHQQASTEAVWKLPIQLVNGMVGEAGLPSTHGTYRTSIPTLRMSAIGGRADISNKPANNSTDRRNTLCELGIGFELRCTSCS